MDDGRRLPVGVVYEDGCNTCECINPRSYCGRWSAFTERAYCACDGTTFIASAPSKPYEHAGPCN
ncbi:MAG TPA: hypothetical protein VHM70_00015 [Polyangiaceae bacterium]|nr:hypothetical protein [Polyangiaceae bacterium]